MRTKAVVGLVLSLALFLAACGGGETSSVGPDEPILQLTSEGGFVPVELALNGGPTYTVLGDGSLIFGSFQTMEFPGTLIPPYQVAGLSDSQLNALLAMVDDIGLPEIDDETDDSARDFVADATTEVITYWDDTGAHRYGVYALGIQEDPSERNAALLELVDTLNRFTSEAPSAAYRPERVRVIAGPAFVDPQFEDVRPWPLSSTDLSNWETAGNGWQCSVFEPDILPTFEDATQATTWEHPDGTSEPLQLLVRPLHPGEADCP